jgi:hypothetical protein
VVLVLSDGSVWAVSGIIFVVSFIGPSHHSVRIEEGVDNFDKCIS